MRPNGIGVPDDGCTLTSGRVEIFSETIYRVVFG
jgi:hypothetical protein